MRLEKNTRAGSYDTEVQPVNSRARKNETALRCDSGTLALYRKGRYYILRAIFKRSSSRLMGIHRCFIALCYRTS
jgi:hypothetical protein